VGLHAVFVLLHDGVGALDAVPHGRPAYLREPYESV
jgi:hypothetical protein